MKILKKITKILLIPFIFMFMGVGGILLFFSFWLESLLDKIEKL